MTLPHEQNYIQIYESAVENLKVRPGDRELQHRAVLSLARAGSLDFAIAEFNRFGLGEVSGHEDIMALDGRLSKDLYLRSNGEDALKHANAATRKYTAAFKATQGYYSGVNSATMAFMAEMPEHVIEEKIAAVEGLLPSPEKLTPEDHYFIEATRAECCFLRGDSSRAAKALQAAVDFDPMNFTAHATTLKQFKMIARKRSEDTNWLNKFSPPTPLHFAGRIRITLSEIQLKQLKINISDVIQKHDIGFAYGALAAGSDIVIAEALLTEGAALHVVLPCPEDCFVEHSVRPFGEEWVPRFKSCLEGAASVRFLSDYTPWPDPRVNRLSGQFAMGQAVLMGHSLSVDPMQILVLGEAGENSYTSQHGKDWVSAGHKQIVLPESNEQQNKTPMLEKQVHFKALIHSSDLPDPLRYETPREALEAAMKLRANASKRQMALHIDIPGVDDDPTGHQMLKYGAPQSLLLSEVFASLLALSEGRKFDISYAGFFECGDDQTLRCYAVNNI